MFLFLNWFFNSCFSLIENKQKKCLFINQYIENYFVKTNNRQICELYVVLYAIVIIVINFYFWLHINSF